MAKQSSVNLDITNNADGFDISGGTTVRKLGVTGGDVTIAGSGSAVVTFPTTSTTIAGLGIAQSFTALQTFSAGISASGATFTGSISGVTATFSKDITVNSMTVGLGKSSDTTNVAIGYVALASNTSDYSVLGVSNVAVGGSALTANTTGSYNTAIGGGALSSNSSGEDNIAIGYGALTNSATASSNIAIGINALALGSLGSFNIGIGLETLSASDNTGNSNVAVGYQSLKTNTTGSNNTGIGTSALLPLTTGSRMTALGHNAGRYIGTATSNLLTGTGGIYIGYQARASAGAQTNEIVIGVNALGLGSNTAVIGATLQSAATIYGVLNLPSGLSASGATFSAPITSTRMARHTSSAISAQKTAAFSPTAAEDGTVFYINYGGKGMDVTLEGLPIGWRAKFFNTNSGTVNFISTTGSVFGIGVSSAGEFMVEAICIATNTYFVG
jgi:hypothetical protein